MLRRLNLGTPAVRGTVITGTTFVPRPAAVAAAAAAMRWFSSNPSVKTSVPKSVIVPKPEFQEPLVLPHEKRPNIMKVVEREALQRANHDGRVKLFRRRASPSERLCPGDVVLVESINSMSKPASTSTFVGVCIAINRRGIDTSFTLRNVLMKVGVEMRFAAYSPMVKRIQILQKGKGFRRAKLYYLRDQPGKVFQLKTLKKMAESAAAAKIVNKQ